MNAWDGIHTPPENDIFPYLHLINGVLLQYSLFLHNPLLFINNLIPVLASFP